MARGSHPSQGPTGAGGYGHRMETRMLKMKNVEDCESVGHS